ncbi:MAG: hydrogenase maturation protease [Proteobacteria bacterium]|jgi:hydrogenase maturation protease|nr:hydrogenase maturation protease [Pseudomonadota bacterium]NLN62467.1 hydrogenase maturation protease [Myxococcales bacterium]
MATTAPSGVLVIGYGNPGRLDDGLGPLLAAALEEAGGWTDVTIDADYQLTVEDAAAIAAHDVVIFMDADTSGPAPFWFEEVEPCASMSFSTHSISPQAVLEMAHSLLGAQTRGFLLGVRGYEFNEFGERLSPNAVRNYREAFRFMEELLRDRRFDEYAKRYAKHSQPLGDDGALRRQT